MAAAPITRGPRSVRIWVYLTAVLVGIAHMPSFAHRLLDGDEAIYGSIAALVNAGGRLYGDGGVDNKPPGIFWVYAAVFRVAGTYNMTAIHLVGLLVMGATCVLIFLVARSLAGVRGGLVAALIYGILTAAGNPRLLAANTELFMMLPLTGSVLLMLRRQWVWAGLLLAVAGAFKQVAGVNVLLLPLAVVLLEPRERRLLAAVGFAGGLVAGLAAGALLLLLTGSLGGFWRWTVGSLYGYASTTWAPELVWQRARDSIVPFVAYMIVPWVAATAYAVRWRKLSRAERVVVVWLVLSVLGSFAGGHLSWHYFIQTMGPLAVLAALGIDRALVRRSNAPRWSAPLRRSVAGAAVAGLAAPMLGWGAYDMVADPLTYDNSQPVPQHGLVAAYIRDHTRTQDRVFVWGDWPALYVESDRMMASRFPGFLRGFPRGSGQTPNNWDTTPDVWPELQQDLARNPPALIVDTAAANWSDFSIYPMSDYPVLADLVASKYEPAATIDGVVIYVSRETVLPVA
jgi:4-amino-4-deoxy-L-arabinose transferase-like glycosyltransferase